LSYRMRRYRASPLASAGGLAAFDLSASIKPCGRDATRPCPKHGFEPLTAKVCWGADITMIVAVNHDGLRALDATDVNRGVHSMCDYSLMHVKSRPASVGDKLRTTNFGTGT